MGIPQAQARLTVEVKQGSFNPIPVALPAFKTTSPQEEDLAKKIVDVVHHDLDSTGLFHFVPPTTFIENPQSMGALPRFGDWRLTGAQNLVTGAVLPFSASGPVSVEFRLWDLFTEQQLEGQALTGNPKSYRKIGHTIANHIYKRLTGEEGHFDTKIVFVHESAPNTKNNKRRLALMDQDGHNQQFLTDDRHLVLTPRLSPTKPQLVYMSYEKSVPQLFLLDLITGKRQPLGDFPHMTFAPRFSPDGNKIVFSASKNGVTWIYEINLLTRQARQLTRSSAIDTSPSYAPDGQRIVFNSDRSGTPQLYVMNTDGTDPKRISFGEGRYMTPVWSPRGDYIAFSKQYKGNFYIGIMRPDGTGERWIAQGYVAEEPTWSPNGRMLIYSHSTQGTSKNQSGQALLRVVDTSGRVERTLHTSASGADWSSMKTFLHHAETSKMDSA